jgi:gamma-glutamyl:cysteine ligase YbdK (ATP-grasp superfamily)
MIATIDKRNMRLATAASGTVEVRVMDTPLTLTHAINIAGLIQATSHWLLPRDLLSTRARFSICTGLTVFRRVAMG